MGFFRLPLLGLIVVLLSACKPESWEIQDKYRTERVLVKACANTDFIFRWNDSFFYERTLSSTNMLRVSGPEVCN